MTRSPWHIQLVGEVLAGIFIIVLIAFPSKIEIRIQQVLYILVEDCQKTLAAGWNGVLLIVCFGIFVGIFWSSILPKQ